MIVILDNIRSEQNVGSIFRTSDAVGVERLILCGITPLPIDKFGRPVSGIVKSALGAELSVPWTYSDSALRAVNKLKKEGYLIIALEQSSHSVSLKAVKPPKNGKFAIIIGSETEGVSPKILSVADKIAEIPMAGKKESLNVAVAFGVAAYALSGLV